MKSSMVKGNMKNVQDNHAGFSVLENGGDIQTAVMILEPSEASKGRLKRI